VEDAFAGVEDAVEVEDSEEELLEPESEEGDEVVDSEDVEDDESESPELVDPDLLPYPSAYQPPPFRWKADKEIFFSVPVSHLGQAGLSWLTRTIFSNSWPHEGQRYS